MSISEGLKYNESHNICAWLEADSTKAKEAPFVNVVNFIKDSNLHFAVTKDVEISEKIIKEFWSSAKVVKEDQVISISAKVDEKSAQVK